MDAVDVVVARRVATAELPLSESYDSGLDRYGSIEDMAKVRRPAQIRE